MGHTIHYYAVLIDGDGNTVEEGERTYDDNKVPLTIHTYISKKYERKYPDIQPEANKRLDKMYVLVKRFHALDRIVTLYEEF